jgi:branched-chain amino acid transport system permease protein
VTWRAFLIGLLAVAGLHFALPEVLGIYIVKVLLYAGINIMLAVSLNLVNGITGQFSIGHAGFMAVGAYAAAFVTSSFRGAGDAAALPLFLGAQLFGGLLAAGAGYVVGLPSLRLRGDYLAIVTLGFGEIIRVLLENSAKVAPLKKLGGALGMSGIPLHTSFGWVFGWVLCTCVVSFRLLDSSSGRALLAVREGEIPAEAMGIDTTRQKVTAFVLGAFFAGVAGALLAHELGTITPQEFNFIRSFEVVTMVVLGGLGSVSGAIVAAVLLTVLPEVLRPLQQLTGLDFRMVIYSLMLIGLMLLRPTGLFGTREITDLLPPPLGRRKRAS